MRGALAVLAAAASLAAGCGGDGGGPAAAREGADAEEASLAGAVEATTGRGSAKLDFVATLEGPGFDEGVELRAVGEIDFARDRSEMTLDFTELAAAQGGSVTDARAWRGGAIYDGDVVYVRMPTLTQALPDEIEWLRADTRALAEQGGAGFNAPDPDQFVRFVDAIRANAEVVGEEGVRGDETTHLRGTVSLATLADVADTRDRQTFASYANRLEAMGLDTFPLDVWIDGDSVIRRIESEYGNLRSGGTELTVTSRLELYDFGADVEIQPPPPGDVTDLADVIGRSAEETEHTEPVD